MSDTEDQPAPSPESSPSPSSYDDQLVVVLLVVSVAIVLLGLAQPPVLVTGVLLGATGALLGLRGKKDRDDDTRARRWLITLVGLALLALMAIAALGFFESWEMSQLLGEGATMARLEARVGSYLLPRRLAQALAVISALGATTLATFGYMDASKRAAAPPTDEKKTDTPTE